MTTPDYAEADLIGPPRRPSDDELAGMPTVKIPWGRPPRRGAPLLVAAAINTLWATALSFGMVVVVVLLARVSLGQRPNGPELPIALAGWLLAHGVPLKTNIGQIGLVPLTITLFAIWRLSRAGVHTTRGTAGRGTGSVRHALRVAAAIGVVYGLFGVVAAFALSRPDVSVQPWRAGVHLLVLGAGAGLLGSLRATGAVRTVARATPLLFRDALRTGVVAALLLAGVGAGISGLAIAISGREAVRIFEAYPSGLAGQAGVTLVCLAYAPNIAAWSAAYLLGPGFVVGAGTAVQPGGIAIAQMPPLPVLAGLPDGALDGPLWILVALPPLTGLAAGLLMVRRRLRPRRSRSGDMVTPVPRWGRMFGSAGLGGLVAGVLSGALAWAASGRLDGGKPFPVGSVMWQVALFAALAVAVGAAAAVVGGYLRVRKQKRAA